MAISKIVAGVLVGSVAVGGMTVVANSFNSENLNQIKSNYTQVEQILKENEDKLVDKYNQLHTDATEEIAKLEEEKSILEQKKIEMETLVEDLKAQIHELENTTIGQWKEKVELLQLELADAEAEIDWLDSELVKYDEMLEEKHAQLIEAKEMIEELQEQVADGETNQAELEAALEKANNEIEKANSEVEALLNESAERAANIENEITNVDELPTLGN